MQFLVFSVKIDVSRRIISGIRTSNFPDFGTLRPHSGQVGISKCIINFAPNISKNITPVPFGPCGFWVRIVFLLRPKSLVRLPTSEARTHEAQRGGPGASKDRLAALIVNEGENSPRTSPAKKKIISYFRSSSRRFVPAPTP